MVISFFTMNVYSKKIIQFITEIKAAIKEILSNEVGLKVRGERFYTKGEWSSYPISIVIYNTQKTLGYFNSEFYELGFHESLMHMNKLVLRNVIRHELAHYIACINYGNLTTPHGSEFRATCEKFGWGKEIYEASTCLDNLNQGSLINESPVLRKIQKLMALSTSSSKHEAEQAMIKSRELLLKHNIDSTYIQDDEAEKMFLKRILKQKKKSAKMSSIGRILETFFVTVVYNRGTDFVYLEILGDAINIEIANYVAMILDSELDKLWLQAQTEAGLRGLTAKNSFFQGLAKGYCNKIGALKKEYKNDTINALMIIEKKLILAKEIVYPRLTQSRSSGGYCPTSDAVGQQMGKNMNINPAVSSSSTCGDRNSLTHQ